MRPLPAACLLALALFPGHTLAQAGAESLPELGSSAGSLITPAEEERYGQMLLRELRRQDLLLEDPLVDGWLQSVGYRLAAASDVPDHSYTFFLMRDRRINAFATLGARVGMNAGLILTAQSEDEVAGVLGHEIAHVTQRHVLRGAEAAQRNQLPIMLAMLGAIAAASQSDSASSDDAIQAAVVGAQALAYQLQINYTRANESEADRVGIQTLHRAGYDPLGIAHFFARMERANRGNSGGWQAPEYLRTHPVTTTRISEARDRAGRLPPLAIPPTHTHAEPLNPLLRQVPVAMTPDASVFAVARERLRVLSAPSPTEAVAEYRALAAQSPLSAPQRYGHAVALIAAGQTSAAAVELAAVAGSPAVPVLWRQLAEAQGLDRGGQTAAAVERFESLLSEHPRHRAVVLSYADALGGHGTPSAGRRAQQILRPLVADSPGDLQLQQRFARASELAGDTHRAREAHAEAAFLAGRAEDALKQFDALKGEPDIDYVQRARVEARMAEIMPIVLEMRRAGLRPQDQAREQPTASGR